MRIRCTVGSISVTCRYSTGLPGFSFMHSDLFYYFLRSKCVGASNAALYHPPVQRQGMDIIAQCALPVLISNNGPSANVLFFVSDSVSELCSLGVDATNQFGECLFRFSENVLMFGSVRVPLVCGYDVRKAFKVLVRDEYAIPLKALQNLPTVHHITHSPSCNFYVSDVSSQCVTHALLFGPSCNFSNVLSVIPEVGSFVCRQRSVNSFECLLRRPFFALSLPVTSINLALLRFILCGRNT